MSVYPGFLICKTANVCRKFVKKETKLNIVFTGLTNPLNFNNINIYYFIYPGK